MLHIDPHILIILNSALSLGWIDILCSFWNKKGTEDGNVRWYHESIEVFDKTAGLRFSPVFWKFDEKLIMGSGSFQFVGYFDFG